MSDRTTRVIPLPGRSCFHGLLFAALTFSLSSYATAGNGWYLLKPPLREGMTDEEILRRFPKWKGIDKKQLHEIAPEFMGDWDAPLSQWTHQGAFDTATACEDAKSRLIELEKSREAEKRQKYPDGYPTLSTTLMRESRCIASDDPRLLKR